ncbi:MAG: acetate/propionate family kinase [Bryobacteraceae bacterium]
MSGGTGQDTAVLTLNCGSSSLKFGTYFSNGETARAFCEGEAEEIGREKSRFWLKLGEKRTEQEVRLPDHGTALGHALDALEECAAPDPTAVGHRFVHGGPRVRAHQRVTPAIMEDLRAAVNYAPLHVPAALAVLDAMQQKLPNITQVVCMDTAFHRSMPEVSRTYALPDAVRELGVERYGFHGLGLESVIAQLHPVPKRLVVAHLGNGASITAIRNGESVDTTMGLTPTAGVMMGTRCGDLDPGAVIFMMRNGYADPQELETVFDRRSGLLGVSGTTSDVRGLLSARGENQRVDLALRMFCYQVRKAIAGMAAALGGLDALAFTGGIGEHAHGLRAEICSGLEFLGGVRVMTLAAQEDLQIAKITAKLVA